MRIFSVIIFCCFQNIIWGQTNKLISAYERVIYFFSGSYDTSYIKKKPVDFIIVLKSVNYLDSYYVMTDNQTKLNLQSDLCYNAGVSLGYKIFLLDYSYNLSNFLFPNSVKSSNMNLNIPTNFLNVELSYFINKGKTNLVGYQAPDTSFSAKYTFEGLNSKVLSVDVFYFVNHKRYANNSAYSKTFGYKQQKNAGSFIIGVSYTRQNLFFDFSQLPINYSLSLPIFRGMYSSYSVHMGYGYNFVFHKYWLANLSVITATGVKENETTNVSDFNFSLKLKMAIAYNRPLFFAGVNCDYTTNYNVITNSLGNFNIYVGYRFLR